MDGLCILECNGAFINVMKDTKRGKRFRFEDGKAVRFTLDLEQKELLCQHNTEWCVFGLDELKEKDDAYRICVFIGQAGGMAELIQLPQ